MHCRDHVVQLHRHQDQFKQLGAEIWVLGFESKRRLGGWRDREEISFPVLSDPEREVYEAYDLERSFWRSWSPRNLWSYVKAFFQGREIRGIEGDPNQLGGDFIVDRDGVLRLTYYSDDPTDHPELERLLEILREI